MDSRVIKKVSFQESTIEYESNTIEYEHEENNDSNEEEYDTIEEDNEVDTIEYEEDNEEVDIVEYKRITIHTIKINENMENKETTLKIEQVSFIKRLLYSIKCFFKKIMNIN